MRLGIGSYTYTWAVGVPGHLPLRPLSAIDLLANASRLGVRVAQFCDNLPLIGLPETELDELVRVARDKGIHIELGTRGLASDNLRAHLRLARQLGCTFLRLVLDSPGDEPAADEALARLREIMPEFRAAGIQLAVENHDRFPASVLARLVERLGPDQAGICLDTVNSFGALEGPEVVVETLAPYTLNLHVKDFTIARVDSLMGFVINGCPAGTGRLNVPWLLERLAAAGRDVNAIVELWTPFGPTLEATLARECAWAEESVGRLRQFIPL